MLSPLAFTHDLLRNHLNPGDQVIDATVGNGKDFLFLSKLVGPTGKVTGFDIQSEAIQNTSYNLMQKPVLAKTNLILDGHENMGDYFQPETVSAIVFNLGYLPGGDKSITTLADTSIQAVEASLSILKSGGLLTLMIYHGHPNGAEERSALENFISNLDQNQYTAIKYQPLNQINKPPYLIAVQKH